MFSFRIPQNLVALALHLADKVFLTCTGFHSLPDVEHQPELPALPLPGRPVFPGSHLLSSLLILGQDGEVVCHTDLVADLPKLPQGIGGLPQLSPRLKADRVNDKVGMDMLGITVCGHLYLIPWPRLGSELQADGMSLFVTDILLGREGLHILVEVDPVQLSICCFCSHKLCDGIGTVAVHAADIAVSCLGIDGLILPLAVLHDSLHCTDMLLAFLDVGYCCQSLPPIRIRAS